MGQALSASDNARVFSTANGPFVRAVVMPSNEGHGGVVAPMPVAQGVIKAAEASLAGTACTPCRSATTPRRLPVLPVAYAARPYAVCRCKALGPQEGTAVANDVRTYAPSPTLAAFAIAYGSIGYHANEVAPRPAWHRIVIADVEPAAHDGQVVRLATNNVPVRIALQGP